MTATTSPTTKTADQIASDLGRDLTRVQVHLQLLRNNYAATVATDPLAARRLVGELRDTARALVRAANELDGTHGNSQEDKLTSTPATTHPRTHSEHLMGKSPRTIRIVTAEASDPS